MGGAPSTSESLSLDVKKSSNRSQTGTSLNLEQNYHKVVRLMMPVYYTTERISPAEYEAAASIWQMILNNTAPEFVKLKQENPAIAAKFQTSILYFCDCFYNRLFDVHPMARSLFKDMKSQGKFLVKMISLSLSEISDAEKFQNTLIKLAEIHNQRGVKAVEYGVVGEVLIYAIRACVGMTAFTNQVHTAWVKIYSRMLTTMVPVAIAHEMKDKSRNQDKRFDGESINYTLSASQTRGAEAT